MSLKVNTQGGIATTDVCSRLVPGHNKWALHVREIFMCFECECFNVTDDLFLHQCGDPMHIWWDFRWNYTSSDAPVANHIFPRCLKPNFCPTHFRTKWKHFPHQKKSTASFFVDDKLHPVVTQLPLPAAARLIFIVSSSVVFNCSLQSSRVTFS